MIIGDAICTEEAERRDVENVQYGKGGPESSSVKTIKIRWFSQINIIFALSSNQ